jgi:hypothetical protein
MRSSRSPASWWHSPSAVAKLKQPEQKSNKTQLKIITMKIKNLLVGAFALGLASSAMAQTEITITGATAFRQATLLAIYNAYNSTGGGLGANFNVAHNFPGNATNQLSQLIASNRAVFVGNFPGITGTTTIRTSFNGSAEGLNAIAGNNNPTFLTAAAVTNTGAIEFNKATPTDTVRPKFSFSDVYQSSTPITTPTLNPVGASQVGVVTFAMVANAGAPASLTNVTQQQFKALLQTGIQKLSLFTGVTTDTKYVFATGRNDGSGTRASYLSEIGYGVSNPVQQYIATTAGVATSGIITAITLVPAGGTGTGNLATSGGAANASTLWGQDNVGNGGYSSSSALRGHMSRTSAACDVYNGVDQTPDITGADILLLTWLSTADAANAAAGNLAKVLSYNGVGITPVVGSGFSAGDEAKITNGQYSAWNYQHLYNWGTLSTNEQTWRNLFTSTWIEPAIITTANGIATGSMNCSRPDDGFPIVAPL